MGVGVFGGGGVGLNQIVHRKSCIATVKSVTPAQASRGIDAKFVKCSEKARP